MQRARSSSDTCAKVGLATCFLPLAHKARGAMLRSPSLAKFADARKQFLLLSLRAGVQVDSARFQQLSRATVANFAAQVKGTKVLSQEEANIVIQHMVDAPMLSEDRTSCIDLVTAKLDDGLTEDAGGAGGSKSTEKQVVTRPEIYLTQKDWEILTHTTAGTTCRVSCLAKRFGKLGLQYPSEITVRDIVALAFHDQGPPELTMSQALNDSRIFKRLLKQHKVPSQSLPIFKSTMAEFKEAWGDWYTASYNAEDS